MALRSENYLLRRYIEKAMIDLPALPSVVALVLSATERETVNNDELEKLIGTDQAILTKLLKVVNSAYFGLPRQISHIGQAITILGLHQVRNLVLSIGVLNALASPSSRIQVYQRKFWQHSFAGAAAARTLARSKNLSPEEAESAYIGGMLHDVGRLFLFTLFNLPYQDVIRESNRKGEPVLSVEQRVLGTTHAELGGALAERWNFPVPLVAMVRDHESPSEAGGSPCLYCVHLADRIAAQVAGSDVIGVAGDVDPGAAAWLQYDEVQLQALIDDAQKQVQATAETLGVF